MRNPLSLAVGRNYEEDDTIDTRGACGNRNLAFSRNSQSDGGEGRLHIQYPRDDKAMDG